MARADTGTPDLTRTLVTYTATVTLGETPLTRIGLGTNRLTHTAENVAFIREAVAAGVSLIDTAHVYTGGESEDTIGAALSSPAEGCLVATKGGYGTGNGRPGVLSAQIEASLRRLRPTASISTTFPQARPADATRGELRGDRGVQGPREDPVRRSLEYVGGADREGEAGRLDRRRPEPLQPLRAHARRRRRLLPRRTASCSFPHPLRDGGPVAAEVLQRHGNPEQLALAWLLWRSPAILPIPAPCRSIT